MAEPFLAEIRIWANQFSPKNWSFCDGQLLPIAQNSALFSIIGSTYGGDGRRTMGLPDLRARVPIGAGLGPGLSDRRLGVKAGIAEKDVPQIPHYHGLKVVREFGDKANPAGNLLATDLDPGKEYSSYDPSIPGSVVKMSSGMVSNVGGKPLQNFQPSLCLHFCIALMGRYPSRS